MWRAPSGGTRPLLRGGYGMGRWGDAFTNRQLSALCTSSDLVHEARKRLIADGAEDSYASAIATYLAFAVSRCSDYGSTLATWASHPKQEAVRNTYSRQAIAMSWDFAEAKPFCESAGSLGENFNWVAKVVERVGKGPMGKVSQTDARRPGSLQGVVVATDPPYYDNVGYADLADFFYVWLRRSLADVYPDLFSTLLTPKTAELIASPYRNGGNRDKARKFFEEGFERVFGNLREVSASQHPLTLFYAFKQAEHDEGGIASTGWETMLSALLRSGLAVTATWPMRTELGNRLLSTGTNALASSVVLACRQRSVDAGITDRRGFLAALHSELPKALWELQQGNIAPVDLAQAAIGPGMAVFSRYAKVVEANGDPMTVRTALTLINQVLDEVLPAQEGEFDADTRFAVKWFEQYGFDEAAYDPAEGLARATNVSVGGLEEAGILVARAGRVRLLPRDKLPANWDPATDKRVTVWEVAQHLVKAIDKEGESKAADLLRKVGGLGYAARDLAYRLYSICERRGWAEDALGYNLLVTSWPRIAGLAAGAAPSEQPGLGI